MGTEVQWHRDLQAPRQSSWKVALAKFKLQISRTSFIMKGLFPKIMIR